MTPDFLALSFRAVTLVTIPMRRLPPNIGDRNEDIRNRFDAGAMGVGGFGNPGKETRGSTPKH